MVAFFLASKFRRQKGKKNCLDISVRPKLVFHRTLANFGQSLSDDRLLFAALEGVNRFILFEEDIK